MIINIFTKNKRIILFILILNLFFFNKLHAQQFKTHTFEGLISPNTPQDSVFFILNKVKEKALLKRDTTLLIKSLISLSAFDRSTLKYSEAFQISGEALFIAEEFGDPLFKAKAYEELGILTYLYKQHSESGDNFNKSHKLYKALYQQKRIELPELYQSHYNLVMHYQGKRDHEKLRAQIDTCLTIGKLAMRDSIYKLYLNEKKASIAEWEGKNEEALKLLKQSAKQIENLNTTIDFEKNHKSFLPVLYGRIALIQIKINELDLAQTYFEKFINIENMTSEFTFYKSHLYSRYAAILSKKGLYEKAYMFEQKSHNMGNTYLNPRNERNNDFLIIKNQYKDELTKKNALLNSKNLEISDQTQKILRFRIFFVIVLLLITILGFLIRSRIRSLKHQKAEQNSQELLNSKNKELTTNTLQLIEREQVIKQLSDFIKETNSENKSKAILKSIDQSSTSLWDSFNRRFNQLNKGFYERLQEKVPDLSRADRKLCALIKLNFSGKEMAHLLGISLGSVHVARHRLRKKMKLERNQNLTSFITSI